MNSSFGIFRRFGSLIFSFVLIAMLFFFSGCNKNQIELITQSADSHTAYELHNIFFVNDSLGYICGGDKWTIGIFERTTDGGKTWSHPDSIINACAYTIQFFSADEGIVAGNVSDWAYTADSGST